MLAGTDRLDKELMIGQMQGMHYPPQPFQVLKKRLDIDFEMLNQENTNSKSSPKQATSSKKTSRRKLLRSWWISISGMIEVRWFFRPRWLICKLLLL